MKWVTTKKELHKALDEALQIVKDKHGVSSGRFAEQIGKLRSLVNHLPEEEEHGGSSSVRGA